MSDSSTLGLLNSLRLPPMDTSDDSLDADTNAGAGIMRPLKACRTCKKEVVLVWQKFVNCRDCRAKNKQKEDLKRARRLERMALLESMSENIPPQASSSVAPSSPPPYVKKAKTSEKKSVQLREAKYLRDLEGKEKDVAVEMMKSHVAGLVMRKGADPYFQSVPNANTGIEYLNATALYNALKACIANSPVKPVFKGFHIVVASDEESHKQKLDFVIRDLRKIVRIPFNYSEPILKQRTKTETMRNATYECNCMGFVSPPPPPAAPSLSRSNSASDRPLKKPKMSSSGGNLMEYMRSQKKAKEEAEAERQRALAAEKTESEEKKRVECRGRVKIQVQEDRSHPCGIVGQKISVTVEHA